MAYNAACSTRGTSRKTKRGQARRHKTHGRPHELQRERRTHQDNLISCNFNIGRPGSCPTVNTSYISIEKEKKRAFVIECGPWGIGAAGDGSGGRKWSRGNWTAVSDDTEGLRAATERWSIPRTTTLAVLPCAYHPSFPTTAAGVWRLDRTRTHTQLHSTTHYIHSNGQLLRTTLYWTSFQFLWCIVEHVSVYAIVYVFPLYKAFELFNVSLLYITTH